MSDGGISGSGTIVQGSGVDPAGPDDGDLDPARYVTIQQRENMPDDSSSVINEDDMSCKKLETKEDGNLSEAPVAATEGDIEHMNHDIDTKIATYDGSQPSSVKSEYSRLSAFDDFVEVTWGDCDEECITKGRDDAATSLEISEIKFFPSENEVGNEQSMGCSSMQDAKAINSNGTTRSSSQFENTDNPIFSNSLNQDISRSSEDVEDEATVQPCSEKLCGELPFVPLESVAHDNGANAITNHAGNSKLMNLDTPRSISPEVEGKTCSNLPCNSDVENCSTICHQMPLESAAENNDQETNSIDINGDHEDHHKSAKCGDLPEVSNHPSRFLEEMNKSQNFSQAKNKENAESSSEQNERITDLEEHDQSEGCNNITTQVISDGTETSSTGAEKLMLQKIMNEDPNPPIKQSEGAEEGDSNIEMLTGGTKDPVNMLKATSQVEKTSSLLTNCINGEGQRERESTSQDELKNITETDAHRINSKDFKEPQEQIDTDAYVAIPLSNPHAPEDQNHGLGVIGNDTEGKEENEMVKPDCIHENILKKSNTGSIDHLRSNVENSMEDLTLTNSLEDGDNIMNRTKTAEEDLITNSNSDRVLNTEIDDIGACYLGTDLIATPGITPKDMILDGNAVGIGNVGSADDVRADRSYSEPCNTSSPSGNSDSNYSFFNISMTDEAPTCETTSGTLLLEGKVAEVVKHKDATSEETCGLNAGMTEESMAAKSESVKLGSYEDSASNIINDGGMKSGNENWRFHNIGKTEISQSEVLKKMTLHLNTSKTPAADTEFPKQGTLLLNVLSPYFKPADVSQSIMTPINGKQYPGDEHLEKSSEDESSSGLEKQDTVNPSGFELDFEDCCSSFAEDESPNLFNFGSRGIEKIENIISSSSESESEDEGKDLLDKHLVTHAKSEESTMEVSTAEAELTQKKERSYSGSVTILPEAKGELKGNMKKEIAVSEPKPADDSSSEENLANVNTNSNSGRSRNSIREKIAAKKSGESSGELKTVTQDTYATPGGNHEVHVITTTTKNDTAMKTFAADIDKSDNENTKKLSFRERFALRKSREVSNQLSSQCLPESSHKLKNQNVDNLVTKMLKSWTITNLHNFKNFDSFLKANYDAMDFNSLHPMYNNISTMFSALREETYHWEQLFEKNICLPNDHEDWQARIQSFASTGYKVPLDIPEIIRQGFDDQIHSLEKEYIQGNEEIKECEEEMAQLLIELALDHYKEEMEFIISTHYLDPLEMNELHAEVSKEAVLNFLEAAEFKCESWNHLYTEQLREKINREVETFQQRNNDNHGQLVAKLRTIEVECAENCRKVWSRQIDNCVPGTLLPLESIHSCAEKETLKHFEGEVSKNIGSQLLDVVALSKQRIQEKIEDTYKHFRTVVMEAQTKAASEESEPIKNSITGNVTIRKIEQPKIENENLLPQDDQEEIADEGRHAGEEPPRSINSSNKVSGLPESRELAGECTQMQDIHKEARCDYIPLPSTDTDRKSSRSTLSTYSAGTGENKHPSTHTNTRSQANIGPNCPKTDQESHWGAAAPSVVFQPPFGLSADHEKQFEDPSTFTQASKPNCDKDHSTAGFTDEIFPTIRLAFYLGVRRTLVGFFQGSDFRLLADVENKLYFQEPHLLPCSQEELSGVRSAPFDWGDIIMTYDIDKLYPISTTEGIFYFRIEDFISFALASIKWKTELKKRVMVQDCVICIPQSFSQTQRRTIHDGASLAGFKTITLLPDTNAIALAFMMNQRVTAGQVIACNTFEGFMDVAYFDVSYGILTCKNVTGDKFSTDDKFKDFGKNIKSRLTKWIPTMKHQSAEVVVVGCDSATKNEIRKSFANAKVTLENHFYPLLGAAYLATLHNFYLGSRVCAQWRELVIDSDHERALQAFNESILLWGTSELPKFPVGNIVKGQNLEPVAMTTKKRNFFLSSQLRVHQAKMQVLKEAFQIQISVFKSSLSEIERKSVIGQLDHYRGRLLDKSLTEENVKELLGRVKELHVSHSTQSEL